MDIDATTQSGYAGKPVIELNGTGAGGTSNGLWVTGGSMVRGLAINRFGLNGTGGGGAGIVAQGSGNVIEQNFLGTDISGTSAQPNRNDGVFVDGPFNLIGGPTPATRNVISGNSRYGIILSGAATTQNSILSNLIGTNEAGTAAVANTVAGIHINGASGNYVGQAGSSGNLIAFNGTLNTHAGIQVVNGDRNAIQSNAIHSNLGLGIDLNANGVTANDSNDADAGANGLQNFPLLTAAFTNGGTTSVGGTLTSTPNTTFRIEFFSNAACDASGSGEGQTLVGSTNVITNAAGTVNFTASVTASSILTATATGPSGNTSEFSACRTATVAPPQGNVTPITLAGFSGSEHVETFSPNFGRQNSPVTFNGVTYTSLAGGQLWSDTVWGNSGYFANYPTASNGTALNDVVALTNLQIDFSTPVNRVGVLPAPGPTIYIMTAYDDNLAVIGSVVVTLTEFRSVFLGLQAPVNIRRVVITEPFDSFPQIGIFDDLRYESVLAPEPLPEASSGSNVSDGTAGTLDNVIHSRSSDATHVLEGAFAMDYRRSSLVRPPLHPAWSPRR